MQTRIHPDLIHLPMVKEADGILRRCVHCGFCIATCPTYQLLGDELDGPRGRIYLLKNLFEDNTIDPKAVGHLDRCLTCRACETTCPSGVQYGRLLDIGRGFMARRTRRPLGVRLKSALLRGVVPRTNLFKPLLRSGQLFRFLLPAVLSKKIPPKQEDLPLPGPRTGRADKKVLLLQGCVQRATTPNVTRAIAHLLASRNVAVASLPDEGCCGAVDYHLDAHDRGLRRMRDLIDKLHGQLLEVDYIVSSASGCGVTIKEYPLHLGDDPEYAAKATAVVEKVVDVSELLGQYEFNCKPIRAAVHTPCSLQHGQRINNMIEGILAHAGVTIVESRDAHLCCGSAGTYSIMQPALSKRLLKGKLAVLQENSPEVIVTANIGCQLHMQSEAQVPVMHWVELLYLQQANGRGGITV